MADKQNDSLFERILSYVKRVKAMEIPIHASYACFFIVLSLFPALVLVLGMLRYTSLTPSDLMELAEQFLPTALEPYIWNLISSTFDHTTQLVVSVSAITALWSAGRGIHGLIRGFNAVYGIREHRGWLLTRLLSTAYTVVFLLMILLTLVLHVFGNTITQLLLPRIPTIPVWLKLIDLRFVLLVSLQTMVFSAMYMFLPDRRSSFRSSLPGALFATFGWMTASSLFSIYVENFSTYSTIYGSVYTVALSMLWLYMCICIIFIGALLNRLLLEGLQ